MKFIFRLPFFFFNENDIKYHLCVFTEYFFFHWNTDDFLGINVLTEFDKYVIKRALQYTDGYIVC